MRRLLVRGLRARRHELAVAAEPRARRAVADREHVVVARRLQRRPHDELVDAVRLETVEVRQHVRRLDAGRPHDQLRRDDLAGREAHAVGQHLGDARRRADLHAEVRQQPSGRRREPLGQRRQDAVGGLDDDDADVHRRVDAVEAERHQRPRRVRQLGRELDAGRAAADDRDLQLVGAQRPRLRMRADARVDEAAMEALGLLRVLERDRVARDARRAEVVRQAADRDDQRVVRKRARAGDLLAVAVPVVDVRRDVDDASRRGRCAVASPTR